MMLPSSGGGPLTLGPERAPPLHPDVLPFFTAHQSVKALLVALPPNLSFLFVI